jgi:iron complex transport system substrate-binding protein
MQRVHFRFPMRGLVLCVLLCLCFCKSDDRQSQARTAKGQEIKRKQFEPQRIICSSPSVTEIVFALGFGRRVVGVSDFSTYPPEAKAKTKIGGLINPNREKIVALHPDLLILQGQNDSLVRISDELGIRFLSIEIDSLEDIWRAIYLIGKELNGAEKADDLVAQIQNDLRKVQDRIRFLPRRKVFLTLGHTPGDLTGLMTTGPGTFIHELLTMAGGDNIFKDATGRFPQISKESLAKRQPEVIIEAIPGGVGEEKQRLLSKDWSQLPMLPAVRSGRIHFLTEDYLLIPGVRIAQTVHRFAQILHPEVFGEPDGD